MSTSPPGPTLPTSLVGSYPQPDWLIDRAKLAGRFPPRVRVVELWRVGPESLAQAQNDAVARRQVVEGSRGAPIPCLRSSIHFCRTSIWPRGTTLEQYERRTEP